MVALVDEYDGPVNDPASARRAVTAMGGADIALLADHGVFVLAGFIRAAHQRAVAFEQRCAHAYLIECAGGGRPLPAEAQHLLGRSQGEGFIGFWEAMARAELRRDPALLALDGGGRVSTDKPGRP